MAALTCPECGASDIHYVGLDDITGDIRVQCQECGDVFYPADTQPDEAAS